MAITTTSEFETWLKDQPRNVHCQIAARAALRAFPAVLNWNLQSSDRFKTTVFALVLETARAVIAMVVAGKTTMGDVEVATALRAVRKKAALPALEATLNLPANIKTAARSAVQATATFTGRRPANLAFSAFCSASRVASRAALAASDAAKAATDNAAFIDATLASFYAARLWHDAQIPTGLYQNWTSFSESDIANSAEWSFWRDWYQGFLDGKPLDWDLQRAIALIPDADWKQGPGHIAGIIEGLQSNLAREKTVLAEVVEFDPQAKRFRVTPERITKRNSYNSILNKLRDAMDDFRTDCSVNLLPHFEPVYRILDRTVLDYIDDAQRVHDDMEKARKRIVRIVNEQSLPTDDSAIQDFSDELRLGALDIRGAMPNVAQAVAQRIAIQFRELPDHDKEILRQATEEAARRSSAELGRDLLADIDAMLHPPLGEQSTEESYRLTSRMIRLGELANTDIVHAAMAMEVGYSFSTMGIEAMQILLSFIGLA